MANVHIGKRIKEVLGQSRFTVVEFARRINKTRTVVYDIFKRDSIDTDLLLKIGKVLEYDFFDFYLHDGVKHFKEERTPYMKRSDVVANLTEELNFCKQQIAELQKKNELLEKLVGLMEEKHKRKTRTKKK